MLLWWWFTMVESFQNHPEANKRKWGKSSQWVVNWVVLASCQAFSMAKTIDWTFSTFLFIQKKLSSKTGLDFLLLYQCLAGWYEFANQSNHLASRNLIIMQKSPGKNLAKYFTNLDFPQIIAGWWFQPPWKICSSNWIISPWIQGENEKYLSCHHLVHQPRFPWNN